MHRQLKSFATRYVAVVIASLVPVIVTTFLSIPYNLGGNPGEPRTAQSLLTAHMT